MADLKGYSQLQARLKAVGSSGTGMMQMLGLSVVREAKLIVPRKTGNLGRSIHLRSASDTRATVEASANYAGFVEHGTKGGTIITPKARKALRWAATASGRRLSGSPRKGAAVIFATRVVRGATRAQPYMMPAAQKVVAAGGLKDIIIREWNGAA